MAAVTCRDCALPYEVWPEGGCPNCRCGEPAPDAPLEPEVSGDGTGEPLPDVDATVEREVPGTGVLMEPAGTSVTPEPPSPARVRPGRRGSRSGRAGGSP